MHKDEGYSTHPIGLRDSLHNPLYNTLLVIRIAPVACSEQLLETQTGHTRLKLSWSPALQIEKAED